MNIIEREKTGSIKRKSMRAVIFTFEFFLILFMISSLIFSIYIIYNTEKKNIKENYKIIADSISHSIGLHFAYSADELIFSAKILTDSISDTNDSKIVADRAKHILNSYYDSCKGFETIKLINEDNTITNINSPYYFMVGTPVSRKPLLRYKNREVYWSDSYISLISGTPVISISDHVGDLLLSAEFSLAKLSDQLRLKNKHYKFGVMDRNGYFIAHSDPVFVSNRYHRSLLLPKDSINESYMTFEYDQIEYSGVFFVDEETGYTIIVYNSNNFLFKNLKYLFFKLLITILVLFLIYSYLTNRFINSIKKHFNVLERFLYEADKRSVKNILMPEFEFDEFNIIFKTISTIWEKLSDREHALFDANEYISKVLMSIDDGIIAFDKNNQIFFSNKAARELLATVNSFDDMPTNRDEVFALLKINNGTVKNEIKEFVDKNGNPLFIDIKFSYLSGIRGNRRGELLVINNVSEQTVYENQMQIALKEKNFLLKEIHHRVKNNLQIISSIINLQTASMTDDQIIQIAQDTENRIKIISILHEKMYRNDDISKVDFGDYIRTVTELLYSFYISKLKAYIEVHYELEEILFGVDTATPLGLFLNEVISNCFKHAYNNTEKGSLVITLKKHIDNKFELNISDNGPGIEDKDHDCSLGMKLINALAMQLNGDLSIENVNGTSVNLIFYETR